MKKVAIVLAIIMVIGILAGGAYALSDGFKKVPWDKQIGDGVLDETQALLKDSYASITFGTGENSWSISTDDKLEPIYINDLRATGKGIETTQSSHGINKLLSEFGIDLKANNLLSVNIACELKNYGSRAFGINYDKTKNDYVVFFNDLSVIYENLAYTYFYSYSPQQFDTNMIEFENNIATEYVSGDVYFMGVLNCSFVFSDIEKYPDYTMFEQYSNAGVASIINICIPVYYRVK